MNYIKILVLLWTVISLTSCSCGDEEESVEDNKSEALGIEIQVVGSLIEGMTLCLDNNVCKKTDSDGMVAFDSFGSYNFKINDINVYNLKIDSNNTIISPYDLFENNETLAKDFLLLLHAFDKGSDISDEKVSLTFSSYIPTATTIESFIVEHIDDEDIVYSVNDHNITIDTADNSIDRDGTDFPIDVPTKNAYALLNKISDFITVAHDKNVTLDNIETKYLLKKETLSSFSLGDSYIFTASAKEDEVVVEIYDRKARSTDSATL